MWYSEIPLQYNSTSSDLGAPCLTAFKSMLIFHCSILLAHHINTMTSCVIKIRNALWLSMDNVQYIINAHVTVRVLVSWVSRDENMMNPERVKIPDYSVIMVIIILKVLDQKQIGDKVFFPSIKSKQSM